ncbi:hypothetical protein ACFQ61_10240 [Streptomyces sp. NPDC056500]|uniref:hypothetical protein n=1 Tax=Streptomyces sp. NPDC056500 TaxID=3345840 RepID=UPI00368898B5
MSKSKTPGRPWFEQLVDSVEALREAAGEWQRAYRAAVLVEGTVDLDRRRLVEGQSDCVRSDRPEGAWDHTRTRRPHEQSIYSLAEVYMDLRHRLAGEYAHAALLFASGVAWAMREVQTGAQPERVAFSADDEGDALPHRRLEITGIDRLNTAARIASAYQGVLARQVAAEVAEGLVDPPYISDHEAAQFHDALDDAAGLPDAAYAYGLLAEGALRFVLLEPRDAYARERAAKRAS